MEGGSIFVMTLVMFQWAQEWVKREQQNCRSSRGARNGHGEEADGENNSESLGWTRFGSVL